MSREINEIYEFGRCRLDVGRRLLLAAGEPVALPPKAFELLLLFVRNAGRALSKQELMTALWPDTFVEEANLSFQVSTLRKALGGEASAWIETIPKHGYRFSVEVRARVPVPATPVPPVAASEPAARTPADVPAPPRTRMDWRWVALGSTVIAIALAAYILVDRRAAPVASNDREVRVVPLTAYEGIEASPSLSPDGSQVAFAWTGAPPAQADIYVKLVGPGEPLRLTTHPARDDSPAWSPDGHSIAFLRWAAGNDDEVDVLLVPALGQAAERWIASVTIRPTARHSSRLAWTSDGKWLAIAATVSPADRHGIWLLSPDGHERRRLTESPHVEGGGIGDATLAFSSDGRHVAFARSRSAGVDTIYVQALSADMTSVGEPVAVTDESSRSSVVGVSWAENDTALIYSTATFLAAQSRLYRLGLSPDRTRATGAARLLPFGDRATQFSASRSGRIVYAAQARDTAFWRLDLRQLAAGPQRPAISPSTYDEHTLAYSRDGTRVAFASTRTGSEELWVSNVDGTGLRQVTFIGGAQCSNPQWSPVDDDAILFNSRLHGSADLFRLDLASGRSDRLTTDPADEFEARWSRDGRSIYFGSNRTGTIELWRMPVAGGAAVRVTQHGGTTGTEGADGYVYYAKTVGSPGAIWRIPIAGGPETPVVDGLSYSLNFAVGRTGLYLVSRGRGADETAIEHVALESGARRRLASLGKRWWFGLTLSPDEHTLLYSVVESVNSDLMVVDRAW
jgi:Tol biopolymer transport system component/DNA-binding winged helix-turn-helix (wHTH) protein